jgi:exosortase B
MTAQTGLTSTQSPESSGTGPGSPAPAPRGWLPAGFDIPTAVMLVLGWFVMYGPTYQTLATTIWSTDEQGHGPIILMVAVWLLWRRRDELAAAPREPALVPGIVLLVFSLLLFIIGRSQNVLLFEAGSMIPMLAAMLLLMKGKRALRICLFPLFFLLFMVPLPATLVAWVTTPLKSAVSAVASSLLYHIGYPVGRTGVIMTVGPYQLLVADACAGLNSMFTLEALGLLYMQLMNYKSLARNVFLAVVVIPIAFAANVIRVIILVLVTYHFGDEAGQGFVHGFAGMVLFMVALVLILAVDGAITAWQKFRARKTGAPVAA